jgi:branched-chain amino acid transport system substrate-binding protein
MTKMTNFSRKIRKYPILAKRLFLIILILSFSFWIYLIFNPQLLSNIFSQNWCKDFELNDNLSCGEESLFTKDKFPLFQQGNFQKAVDFFTEQRRKDKNNPEILIYLNNAKLMQKGKKSYTIAIVVPINQDARGTAEGLLRGAAQVQEDFNKNPQHPGLKILVVNDENKPDTVNNLAKHLLSKDDVVAVIGHYTSELTRLALPVYQQKRVVVISPATAARNSILSGKKFPQNFLFRTVPSVKFEIPLLIDKLQLSQLASGKKVAIFYTPSSTFSKSAFEEFRNQLGANRIIERDVSSSRFTPDSTLNEVKQQGAKALILIPDGQVTLHSFKNTLSLIDVNEDQLPIGGQSVLYDERILNKKNIVKNLSIVISWHPLRSPNQEVVDKAKQLWGTGKIGVQSGISYDATLVLTTALEKVSINDRLEKQRSTIQQQLNGLQIKEGASGNISFDQDGDRKENPSQIVHVVPTKCSKFGAIFVPMNYDLTKLDCQQMIKDNKINK